MQKSGTEITFARPKSIHVDNGGTSVHRVFLSPRFSQIETCGTSLEPAMRMVEVGSSFLDHNPIQLSLLGTRFWPVDERQTLND